VPPVTGVLIRARKLPDIFPALYSTVALAGTVIVVKEVHVVPKPGNGAELVGVAIIEGQHSIVTAPPVTGPQWHPGYPTRSPAVNHRIMLPDPF